MFVFTVIPNARLARFMLVLRFVHDTVRFMLILGDIDLRCRLVTVVSYINDTSVSNAHRENETEHDDETLYLVDAVQNSLLCRKRAST